MASTSPSPSPSSSAASGGISVPSQFKVVGVLLAVMSGLLIGSSFVFKKKGLLRSQMGKEAGEGVAYLKSPLWWTGMTMMILGEICNFVAYAFVEAIVVTPLGALSVVICAILSSIFLKEKLTFFGWLGCGLCIVGSTVIALNGPQEQTVGHILDFQKMFLAPGFLVWGGLLIAASLTIIFYFGPRYGKKSMLWYIFVCSMIGGLSVSCTTGLGASIVTSIQGDNQFKHPFIYFLLGFVAVTLVTEVLYLNKALALFNTAMVTPTYYVIFTFFTLVTTVVLFQGLKSTVMQILTIVCGFLTICAGITILQMSKVDPTQLNKLDRRSTILLQAARHDTEMAEKSLSGIEDPGMDALRGSFGTFGSIIRARSARRMSMSQSHRTMTTGIGLRHGNHGSEVEVPGVGGTFQRHQLYDPPVPKLTRDQSYVSDISLKSTSEAAGGAVLPSPAVGGGDTAPNRTPRTPTIKFDERNVAHYYPQPGASGGPRHEIFDGARPGMGKSRVSGPLPPLPPPSPEPSIARVASPDQIGDAKSSINDGSRSGKGALLERVLHTAPAAESSFFASRQGSSPYHDPYDSQQTSRFSPIAEEETSPSNSKARKPSHRHYPRTGGDEDKEESIGLVNKDSPWASQDSVTSQTNLPESGSDSSVGGVRLVTSSKTRI